MNKQERIDEAFKNFLEIRAAITEPARKAYEAEVKRIENEPDEPDDEIIEVDGKRYQLIK